MSVMSSCKYGMTNGITINTTCRVEMIEWGVMDREICRAKRNKKSCKG